ncbi:cell division protein PerM [Amycolatopsis jiangsuensis]|uniref:Uncharacterized protein n=1 Tax=Amycolatopsis jiangsuensis TaxID=1181879 RepID=A0A840IXW3_9PSEU|nr:DUF6350 family protein [Amycolatopsis jiangsuensis]MBB4686349.1 hypothetical protein [Amycolatopsis jiangsuensis]
MQVLTRPDRPAGDEPVDDTPGADGTPATRLRVVLGAALGPLVTGYAVVATLLALVTLTAERTEFSAGGVLLSAGPGWLAAYQVQLGIGGHPLGVLPLLPTIAVLLLVARTASGAAARLGYAGPRQAVPLIAAITGAHVLFGLVIGLFSLGEPVRVNPALAAVVPGVFAAVAATGGVLRRCGLPVTLSERLDPLAIRGLRAGLLGLSALVLIGALVLTAATAFSAHTVSSLFEPSIGSSFGLLLLSVLYLPNGVVAAMSFATGPGFTVGELNVHLVGYRGGSVPAVPLLGGIPEHAAAWWPVLLVLPLAVGLLVGWMVRNADDDPAARIRIVVVAGAVVGFGCVVLGTFAGGRLGDGPFDPVSVPVGVASIVAFCWIVIPAGFVAFFAGAHAPPRAPAGPAVEDEESVLPDAAEDPEAADDEPADTDDSEASGDAEDDPEDGEDPGEFETPEAADDSEESEDADPADDADPAADAEAASAAEDSDIPEAAEPADEFDAEADAELGLELPEDVPPGDPEPPAEQSRTVTESTEDSGDEKHPGADR